VNYLDTVLREIEKLYMIKGEPGSGKATLLGKVAGHAQAMGL